MLSSTNAVSPSRLAEAWIWPPGEQACQQQAVQIRRAVKDRFLISKQIVSCKIPKCWNQLPPAPDQRTRIW
jgi:hypothetical protein